jgi:TolB-like protein/Tfp pilus assembly protein PilF
LGILTTIGASFLIKVSLMAEAKEAARAARFGPFELDLGAGELLCGNSRIRLQEKPFQILALLLERKGQVVTREDLRRRLWAPDTHVGFDRNVNTAVNKLRQALGDSPRSPRYIETLAKRGYRFIAPVHVSVSQESPPDGTGHEHLHSVAVLPFEIAEGDPEMDYLADGITDTLISALSRLSGIRVMARTTVFRYKGRPLEIGTLARELNVHAALFGRIAARGGNLEIATELVEVRHGWRLWGEQYHRPVSDIQAIQEEIAREISDKLRLHLTREQEERLSQRSTENTVAYQDYLRGRYHWNKMTEEGLRKGIEYFERAIGQDPGYALAYSGLADCYGMMAHYNRLAPREVMPKAKVAAEKAVELDDRLAEGHASLAGILNFYDWDFAGAEREYRRALDLNPNYAVAHHRYGDLLSALGRAEEALAETRRALDLDPLSLVINMGLAWNLYIARDYRPSLEQSLRALEMDPALASAQFTLGLAYEQMEQFPKAIEAFESVRDGSGRNPTSLASLAHVYTRAGKKRLAMAVLKELTDPSRSGFVLPSMIALVYAGLGEKEQALAWLEKAFEHRDASLVWLKTEPRFDALRSLKKFRALLTRVGFPD